MMSRIFLIAVAFGFFHPTALFAKTTAAKVQQETAEAVDAAGAYAGEKKEEFSARMKQNIETMDRSIEELKADSQSKSKEVQAVAQKKIEALQARRDALAKRYEALEKSTGKAWIRMRTGIEKAWTEVGQAYKEAKSEISTKK